LLLPTHTQGNATEFERKNVLLQKNIVIWKEEIEGSTDTQRAVLRDCGSKPADNAVEISKLLPRRKFSGSRHYAKPPPR